MKSNKMHTIKLRLHFYKPRKKAIKSASEGILCGSGKVAGATLRVLEGLHKAVVYHV